MANPLLLPEISGLSHNLGLTPGANNLTSLKGLRGSSGIISCNFVFFCLRF